MRLLETNKNTMARPTSKAFEKFDKKLNARVEKATGLKRGTSDGYMPKSKKSEGGGTNLASRKGHAGGEFGRKIDEDKARGLRRM